MDGLMLSSCRADYWGLRSLWTWTSWPCQNLFVHERCLSLQRALVRVWLPSALDHVLEKLDMQGKANETCRVPRYVRTIVH
jgi:hypothetical protein